MRRTKRLLAVVLAMVMVFAVLPMYGMEVNAAERYADDDDYDERGGNIKYRATITLKKSRYTYDGTAKTPSVTVKMDGKTLVLNKDYTVAYSDNINVGSARVEITGKGNYEGSRTVCFIIQEPSQYLESGDYLYQVNDDGASVSIVDYFGEEDAVLDIPSQIDGKKVTSLIVGEGITRKPGFNYEHYEPYHNPSWCCDYAGIKIPTSVEYIDLSIFTYSNNVKEFSVASENPEFSDADGILYDKEKTTAYLEVIEKESATIPEGVVSIGDRAFYCKYSLKSITLPKSLKSIGVGVFEGCEGLESAELPEGLEHIGEYAFYSAYSLKDITIPKSVEYIGAFAFKTGNDVSSGVEIDVAEDNPYYKSIDGVLYDKSGTTLLSCPLQKAVQVTSPTTPEGVKHIGEGAFYICDGLKSLIIADGVETIGERAFGYCLGMQSVSIPNSVVSIGKDAFFHCSLKNIYIPASVVTIGEHAFGVGESYNPASGKWEITPIEGFVVYGGKGTAAETYAKDNGLTFEEMFENDIYRSVVQLEENSYIYDGTPKMPSVTVKMDGRTLVLNTDYTVAYSNNTNMGTASVTVKGIGKYTGSKEESFFIRKDISKAEVTLPRDNYAYNGWYVVPSVTVKLDGETLSSWIDYTVSYSDNIDIGTAKVTVTGKGNYTGSVEKTFTISRPEDIVSISKATVTLAKTSYTYDGKAKKPSVTVKLDGKSLVPNTDYTVYYSNNTNVGTAWVTIIGKGNYIGTKSVNFTITKAGQESSITCKKTLYKVAYGAKPFKINATSGSKLTFTSSKSKIASVNKNTGEVTIKNTGVATITVKAGTKSVKVTVKVSPKKASLKSAKAVKGKKLTAGWAKDKTASGYQVQISTAKNFKKNVKSKNVSKTSYTFTKLKTGKKYYVRVRSYKKSGKETLYGGWSTVKQSGKIKK